MHTGTITKQEKQTMSLHENTIALSLSIHRFGTSRGIKSEQLIDLMPHHDDQIREKFIGATKKLFQSKEYDAIVSLDNSTVKELKARSLPSMLRRGIYLVPTGLVQQVTNTIGEYAYTRQEKVHTFIMMYEYNLINAQSMLGALYDPMQYPSKERMAQLFSVEARWLDLGVPSSLALINPAIFEQAKKEMLAQMQEAEEHCKALLRAEVMELSKGLHQALQGLDDGTLKRFHLSHTEKIKAWCDIFSEARNVTNDKELQEVVTKLRWTVDYAGDSTELRSEVGVRSYVKKELEGCLTELKALTEACPLRTFDFEA